MQALEIAPILKFFANSLIVATITTILNVFCLAMAGYVFAKKRFRFKNTIFAILSLSMVIPTTALMSPVYNIITKLGLYDTKIALILVYTALNMPISLMVLDLRSPLFPQSWRRPPILMAPAFSVPLSR